MTASHGLRSDSHDVVYSEDVVTYADPQDVADGTSDAYGVCVGLVSRVAGDDAEDEDEWRTTRTSRCRTTTPRCAGSERMEHASCRSPTPGFE